MFQNFFVFYFCFFKNSISLLHFWQLINNKNEETLNEWNESAVAHANNCTKIVFVVNSKFNWIVKFSTVFYGLADASFIFNRKFSIIFEIIDQFTESCAICMNDFKIIWNHTESLSEIEYETFNIIHFSTL